jgi:IPT/TIG domain-containing protein/PASTA domain-containing protein
MRAQEEMRSTAKVATMRGKIASRFGLALLAANAWTLLAAGSAQAASVTVGSPLTASFAPAGIGQAATLLNSALPEPGAKLTSPIDGAIVRWRIQGASGGPFRLRVLTPVSGVTYTGGGSTAPQTPSGTGLQTFAAALPIKAGQTIALDNTLGTDQIGAAAVPGASYIFWVPPLAEGSTTAGTGPNSGVELAFNADVQPPPTISSVTPSSGTFKGGTGVTITGSDFADVKSIAFGTTPAQSFGVGSEGQITAIAPAAAGPGPVDISVTTVAGKSVATSVSQFTYTACVVPKLKQKKVKAARKALRRAGCKLGKVKRSPKAGKGAKVIKQSAKPRTVLPPGSKVNVTLGKGARHPQPKA